MINVSVRLMKPTDLPIVRPQEPGTIDYPGPMKQPGGIHKLSCNVSLSSLSIEHNVVPVWYSGFPSAASTITRLISNVLLYLAIDQYNPKQYMETVITGTGWHGSILTHPVIPTRYHKHSSDGANSCNMICGGLGVAGRHSRRALFIHSYILLV